ncbi:MAG: hypothetical protein IJA36_06965 [Lachnospiraceae bacterium]|nr:hypothetical protein [Lachnospiraceae bacterium]
MKDKDTVFSKICFKELSFERKLEYLWDYYKFHFFGSLLVLILLIGGILIWQENSKPDILNGYLLNTNWGDDLAAELLKDFADAKGYDLDQGNAYFNSSVFIDTDIKDQMSTVAYTKVMTDLDMKEIDFFFCNQEMFEYFGEKETFLDLSQNMPEEFLNKFQDKLITTDIYDENGNVTNTYIAGMDISDAPILIKMQEERKLYEDDQVLLTLPYNTTRLDKVMEFIEFLYGE